MSNLSITVDVEALQRELDRLGDRIVKHVKPRAKVTAERIASEARTRVARRSGKTAEGIGAEEAIDGNGYVAFALRDPFPDLPAWLEHGTDRMTPRPFFDVAVTLEEDSHRRRIAEAIADAIADGDNG